MTPATPPNEVRRLAVIDDDPDTAEITCWQVEDAGFEPVPYPARTVSGSSELSEWVAHSADGAVCDHRLMARGFANFFGASVVSELFERRGVPAILVTQYVDMDQDVSIRRWRRNVPVLLSRDEANAESIRGGIEICLAELNGDVPSSRKPYRSLVHIDALGNEANEPVMDVIIPSWNNHHAVRLPSQLLPRRLQSRISQGTWLFADVNIGAKRSQDLFFADFELAPEPRDNAFS